MPEGDTIFRAARTLHRVFAGKTVTRFESVFPALTRVHSDHPVIGRTVVAVFARGKHLLVTFSGNAGDPGDLVLRTHMRMNGSWHVYPVGVKWQKPAADMRVLFGTNEAVAVGFNVPVAEFLTARQLARSKALGSLGPDVLDPSFDRAEAVKRIREHGRQAICDVLINQRVVAGIGNEFKSEILFLAGVDPFASVASLDDATLARVMDVSRDQLRANVMSNAQTLSPAFGRRTFRSLNPNEKLWVYGRGGRPCRRCATSILSRATGLDARLTYWCPRCQPAQRNEAERD